MIEENESIGPEEQDDYVPLMHAKNMDQAEEYCLMLEDNDIPAMVDDDYTPRRKGGKGVPVLVPATLLEEAKAILEELEEEAQEEEVDTEEEEEDDLDEEEEFEDEELEEEEDEFEEDDEEEEEEEEEDGLLDDQKDESEEDKNEDVGGKE